MSSIKATKLDGDLSVGRNLSIGGKATIQGNSHLKGGLKVDGWLEAPNVKGPNKGIFSSLEKLKAEYPFPRNGWYALVGTSLPAPMYVGDNGDWVATGGTGGNMTADVQQFHDDLEALEDSFTGELTELENKASSVGYVTCDTPAATAAKTITVTGMTALSTGIRMLVKMSNNNTAANATLNINSLGAKPLYYNNKRVSGDNAWSAGEVIEVYYDGTNFYSSNVLGGAGSGGNMILDWNTDVDTTRKQVKQKDRKALLQISYKNDSDIVINEQYKGTSLSDAEWGKNENWEQITSVSDIFSTDSIVMESVNLAEDYNSWEEGLLEVDGTVLPGYGGHTSDFIPINGSREIIKFKGKRNYDENRPVILSYDKNKTVIEISCKGDHLNEYFYATFSGNTAFVRLSSIGKTAEFYKVGLGEMIKEKFINDAINKENKAANLTTKGFIDKETGSITLSTGDYYYTDYIEIDSGDKIYTNATGIASAADVAFYDESKVYLGFLNRRLEDIEGDTYDIPEEFSNARYVRAGYVGNKTNTFYLYIIRNESGKYTSVIPVFNQIEKKIQTFYQFIEANPVSYQDKAEFDGDKVVISESGTLIKPQSIYRPTDDFGDYSAYSYMMLRCDSIEDSGGKVTIAEYGQSMSGYKIEASVGDEFIYVIKYDTVNWVYISVPSAFTILSCKVLYLQKVFAQAILDPLDLNSILNSALLKYSEKELTERNICTYESYQTHRLINENPYFKGKSYCSFGTSITAGGATPDPQSYVRWVGGYFDMKVVNIAKSSTVSHGVNGNIRTELLAKMPKDTALVTMMNGANGWITGDIDSEDTENSVGAYNVAINYIKEHYPAAVIVIGPDYPIEQTIKDLKAIAEKHNVLYAHAENITTATELRGDSLHLSRLGNYMMAASIIKAAENSILQTIKCAESIEVVPWS